MSWSIVERTVGAETERRFSLGAITAARVMGIGTTWNQLRIGILSTMNTPSASISGPPIMAFGVCADTTNLYGEASTDHFVGAIQQLNPFSYSYYDATHRYLYGSFYEAKKVGTTQTVGGGGLAYPVYFGGWPTSERTAVFLEITKGSPNFTLQMCHKNNLDLVDCNVAKFRSCMEAVDLAGIRSILGTGGHAVGTARTLAVNEGTDGDLNAVALYWERSTPEWEISEVAFRALS